MDKEDKDILKGFRSTWPDFNSVGDTEASAALRKTFTKGTNPSEKIQSWKGTTLRISRELARQFLLSQSFPPTGLADKEILVLRHSLPLTPCFGVERFELVLHVEMIGREGQPLLELVFVSQRQYWRGKNDLN